MTKEAMVEKLKEMMSTMKEEELVKMMREAVIEFCMEFLKEKTRDLKLSNGRVKELHDFLAEQFILTYIEGKSLWMIMDDLESGRLYNTWSAAVLLQVGKLLRQR